MQKGKNKPSSCPKCHKPLTKVNVKVEMATSRSLTYQCGPCEYVWFDPISAKKVIEEIRAHDLKIKQKVIKLSADRLGIYFNSHIVRRLNLKKGEDGYVSGPDKNHMLIDVTG